MKMWAKVHITDKNKEVIPRRNPVSLSTLHATDRLALASARRRESVQAQHPWHPRQHDRHGLLHPGCQVFL